MSEENENMQGYCAYCGEAQLLEGYTDQDEADKAATEGCNCKEAKAARKEQEEERDRDGVLAGAKEDIWALFSEEGVGEGETYVSEAVLEGLYSDAVQVFDEELRKVNKTIKKGITAVISRTDKDKLTVQRNDNRTQRRQR